MLSEQKLRKIARWLRDACTDAGQIADALDPARDHSQYSAIVTRMDSIARITNETACIVDVLIQNAETR